MRRTLLMLVTALALGGCDDDETADAGPGRDGGDLDGALTDAGPGDDADPRDGDLPDGDLPDGDLPDGDLPDGDLPDGDLPDGDLPDGDLPDGGPSPDGEVVDAGLIDAGDTPVAANDRYDPLPGNTTVLIGVELGPLENDRGADLSAEVVEDGATEAGGVYSLSAQGDLRYRSALDFTGVDRFTYAVVDANGERAEAVVELVVGPRIVHVDNTADAGGDGTDVAPFSTLAAGLAAADPGTVVFLRSGDGTTSGQNAGAEVPAGVRLVGEGVEFGVGDHYAVGAGDAPPIENPGGSGVTLAAGAEVAGVAVVAPVEVGVRVVGDDALARGLTVDGSSGHGVELADSPRGGVTLTDVQVTDAGGAGVFLGEGGAPLTGDTRLERVRIERAGAGGVVLDQAAGEARLRLSEVAVNGAGEDADGISVHVRATAELTVEIDGCTIEGLDGAGDGVRITTSGAGAPAVDVSVDGCELSAEEGGGDNAIRIVVDGAGASARVDVVDNRAEGWNGDAIAIGAGDVDVSLLTTIRGNRVGSDAAPGSRLGSGVRLLLDNDAAGSSRGVALVADNEITDVAGFGVVVLLRDGADADAHTLDATVVDNLVDGAVTGVSVAGADAGRLRARVAGNEVVADMLAYAVRARDAVTTVQLEGELEPAAELAARNEGEPIEVDPGVGRIEPGTLEVP